MKKLIKKPFRLIDLLDDPMWKELERQFTEAFEKRAYKILYPDKEYPDKDNAKKEV